MEPWYWIICGFLLGFGLRGLMGRVDKEEEGG